MKTKKHFILLSSLVLVFSACNGKDTKNEQDLQVYTTKAIAAKKNFHLLPNRSERLNYHSELAAPSTISMYMPVTNTTGAVLSLK